MVSVNNNVQNLKFWGEIGQLSTFAGPSPSLNWDTVSRDLAKSISVDSGKQTMKVPWRIEISAVKDFGRQHTQRFEVILLVQTVHPVTSSAIQLVRRNYLIKWMNSGWIAFQTLNFVPIALRMLFLTRSVCYIWHLFNPTKNAMSICAGYI